MRDSAGLIPVFGSNGAFNRHSVANTEAPVIIVGRKGSFGSVTFSELPCWCIDTAYWIDAKSCPNELRWLYYALQTLGLDRFSQDTGVPGLSRETAYNYLITLPNHAEQRAIADFLDRETAEADALVAKYERLIELLEEKRVAHITQAVTKGLDPTVPMKDSGIEWLGQIPATWVAGPIKYFLTMLDGKRIPISGEERSGRQGPYPYYGASGVIDHIDDFIFDEDLILVGEDGANLVNRATPLAFLAQGKYWVNNHAHILRPKQYDSLNFWVQRIEMEDISSIVTGSAQPKLTIEVLKNLKISAPTKEDERRTISGYIEKVTKDTDLLKSKASRAIELIRERRSALITAAVTGQIDVNAYRLRKQPFEVPA